MWKSVIFLLSGAVLFVGALASFANDSQTSNMEVGTKSAPFSDTNNIYKPDGTVDGNRTTEKALKGLGFYHGPIDGVAGEQLRKAVQAYFRAAGVHGAFSDYEADRLTFSWYIVAGTGATFADALRLAPQAIAAVKRESRANNEFEIGNVSAAMADATFALGEYRRLFGPDNNLTLSAMSGLGHFLVDSGEISAGHAMELEAYKREVEVLGADDPVTVGALGYLMQYEIANGNTTKAIGELPRIIDRRSHFFGSSSDQVFTNLNDLGNAMSVNGRLVEAAEIYRDIVNRSRKNLNEFASSYIVASLNLATTEMRLGNLGAAESYVRAALEDTHIGHGYYKASAEVVLGSILLKEKRLAEAKTATVYAYDLAAKSLGDRSPIAGSIKASLADIYSAQGQYDEAVQSAKDGLRLVLNSLPAASPAGIEAQLSLAKAYAKAGKIGEAKDAYQTLLDGFQKFAASNPFVSATTEVELRDALQEYLALLAKTGTTDDHAAKDAYVAQSWWTYGPLELAMNDLGERLAASDPAKAEMLRKFQDVRDAVNVVRSEYAASFRSDSKTLSTRSELAAKLSGFEAQLEELKSNMTRSYPDLIDLTATKPMTVEETQSMLAPDEGLMAMAVAQDQVYVWLVTPHAVQWRATHISRDHLAELAKTLRTSVDLSLPASAVSPTDGCRIDSPAPFLSGRAFDTCSAHEIYDAVFGNLDLSGIRQLIVVPDGPFEAIPFSLLVSGFDQSHQPDWLIKRVALSVLPTTSSLRSLREAGSQNSNSSQQPFLGIAPGDFTGLQGSSVLHVTPPSLPGTLKEVDEVAKILSAGDSGTVIGSAATENYVKTAPLADYRVLSFSTHALLAKEAEYWTGGKIRQPALLLYGPGDAKDDGLLTASEAAALKLDADWVILSGCNTAGSDGESSEGFTGLARSFFFAGARSLLVSEWSVDDVSSEEIITQAIGKSSSIASESKAEALRAAMISVMNTPGYGHPFFWAPFELVGIGDKGVGLPPSQWKPDVQTVASLDARFQDRGGVWAVPELRGVLPASASAQNSSLDQATAETEASLGLSPANRTEIQRRLKFIGFDPKGFDGGFGPMTRAALSKWQEANGSLATGFLNASQLTSLKADSEPQYQKWKAEQVVVHRVPNAPKKECLNLGFVKLCG